MLTGGPARTIAVVAQPIGALRASIHARGPSHRPSTLLSETSPSGKPPAPFATLRCEVCDVLAALSEARDRVGRPSNSRASEHRYLSVACGAGHSSVDRRRPLPRRPHRGL